MSSQPITPRIPANLQPWFEARQRFKLSHATVQMARELGLNPKKLGKLADLRGSPWKVPLADFIAECYFKAHKKRTPDLVRSLEQVINDAEAKKARNRERKLQRRQLDPGHQQSSSTASSSTFSPAQQESSPGELPP